MQKHAFNAAIIVKIVLGKTNASNAWRHLSYKKVNVLSVPSRHTTTKLSVTSAVMIVKNALKISVYNAQSAKKLIWKVNVNRFCVSRGSTSVVINVKAVSTIVNDALMVKNVSSATLIFNLMAVCVKRASLTNSILVASV